MWIGHRKEIPKLTFRALALRQKYSPPTHHHGLIRYLPIYPSKEDPGNKQPLGIEGSVDSCWEALFQLRRLQAISFKKPHLLISVASPFML